MPPLKGKGSSGTVDLAVFGEHFRVGRDAAQFQAVTGKSVAANRSRRCLRVGS